MMGLIERISVVYLWLSGWCGLGVVIMNIVFHSILCAVCNQYKTDCESVKEGFCDGCSVKVSVLI